MIHATKNKALAIFSFIAARLFSGVISCLFIQLYYQLVFVLSLFFK